MKNQILLAIMLVCAACFPKNITLTAKNSLRLNSEVDGTSVATLQQELLAKRNAGAKELFLVLDSPGGSIEAGMQLIETAKGLGIPVHTLSLFSASMSFVISQNLSKRYAIQSATLMSHRAYGGVEGTMPGSIESRLNYWLAVLHLADEQIAARAHLKTEVYRDLVKDELWMNGAGAQSMNFIDEVVTASCDASLAGSTTETFEFFGLRADVEFAKCPLISAPLKVELKAATPTASTVPVNLDKATQVIRQHYRRRHSIKYTEIY